MQYSQLVQPCEDCRIQMLETGVGCHVENVGARLTLIVF